MPIPRHLGLEEAAAILLQAAEPAASFPETVPLTSALGRIAYAGIAANFDLPPFDRSPLDGYAVNHLDLNGASPKNPARLKVSGQIFAGETWQGVLARGQALRLMTGSPIPAGADCVVRQEDTCSHADGQGECVEIFVELNKNDNFCFQGEDLPAGTALLRKGERINPGHLGLLAAEGLSSVAVFPRVRLGILSTGNELAEAGKDLRPGQIHDCNGPLLSALAVETGAEVVSVASGRDEVEGLANLAEELWARSDLVLSSGGVSVGSRDHLPEVAARLGGETLFHGVDLSPGSPLLAFRKAGKLFLALSGNPFAVFVTYHLLAAPVLRRLGGMAREPVFPDRVAAVLGTAFPKRCRTRRFVPGWLEGGTVRFPAGRPESRSLSSLVCCNCLVDLPEGSEALAAGAAVRVVPL